MSTKEPPSQELEMSKKIAAYVRVSTTGQNEDGQVAAIQKWVDGHGVSNVTWFVDKATGKNLDRVEFKKLQTAIFNGEFDTVLCYKLDRIARNMKDGVNVLTDWLEKKVRIVAVTQELDFSGAVGKLVASVLFAVSEMEMELRKERQADGIAVAKTKGTYQGRKAGATTHSPKRIVELLEKGLNHSEIATTIGCSTKTIQRIARNPLTGQRLVIMKKEEVAV